MPAAFKAGNGCFRRINKHGRDFVVRTQPVNRAKCRLENKSCKLSVESMNTAMANDEAGIRTTSAHGFKRTTGTETRRG
jgi:hypothetical protein